MSSVDVRDEMESLLAVTIIFESFRNHNWAAAIN
jgi:hypothetical protein